jgi:hypothetical protein
VGISLVRTRTAAEELFHFNSFPRTAQTVELKRFVRLRARFHRAEAAVLMTEGYPSMKYAV